MRQTLIRIPLDGPWSLGPLGEVPGFGIGIVLLLWVLGGAAWLYWNRHRIAFHAETLIPVAVWFAVAAGIALAPTIVQSKSRATIASLTASLEQQPNQANHYLSRGDAYRKIREYDKAAADYREAIRLNERSVAAHGKLAWLLATCPQDTVQDGKAAVVHANRALALASPDGPDYPRLLDTLAAAEAATTDYDAAVENAQNAAELAWNSPQPGVKGLLPDIRKHLGRYLAGQPVRDTSAGVSIPLYGYGLMFVVGLFAGGWTATRRAQRIDMESEQVWDLIMWVAFLGIAGARVFYCVQKYDQVFYERAGGQLVLKSPLDLLLSAVSLPDGGLVLYGGVLAGIATYIVFCRRRGLNPVRVADAMIPSVFIGLAFGRIGCFLNGCCYGGRCDLPWAVSFPLGSVTDSALIGRGLMPASALDVMQIHPTQIYSSLNALVLAIVTHWYFKQRPREGSVLLAGWLAYPVTRFFIEYIRTDERPVVVTISKRLFGGTEPLTFQTPFTIAQWVSLGVFAAGLVFLVWWTKRPDLANSTARSAGKVATPVHVR